VIRLDNWIPRFQDVLEAAEGRSFSWGTWDCTHFANACVEALTGQSLLPKTSPYSTAREALSALNEAGYKDMLDALDALLGSRKPVLMARRGDIVATNDSAIFALGVVDLSGENVVFLAESGLSKHPISFAAHAWSVG